MHARSPSFLVPIAVAIVLALVRRYAPQKFPSTAKENYSQQELDAHFGSTQWIVGVGSFAVGCLLAWIFYAGAIWLNRYWASLDGPADYVIWPQSAIWWFLPLFAPLTLAWEITLQIWSLLGHRAEADLYGYWSGNSARFNSRKVLRWAGLLVVLPIAVFTFLAVSIHTALRSDDIRDCGYAFTTCKTYKYADARRITLIDGFRNRDGSLTKRAGIVVDFNDGRRWSSADGAEFSSQVDPALQHYLQEKIPLPLNHLQAETDIPRLY